VKRYPEEKTKIFPNWDVLLEGGTAEGPGRSLGKGEILIEKRGFSSQEMLERDRWKSSRIVCKGS